MYQYDDIGYLLKLINGCIEKKVNQELKLSDLTLSQVRVLLYLNGHKETKTSQKDLEDFFGVTHPTIVGIINRLEKKNFIKSCFDSEDKRVKNIYLTDYGSSFYNEMNIFKKNTEVKLLQGLSKVQTQELKDLLNIIYKNISE